MIACIRIADAVTVTPGSVARYCHLCAESVWVSPALLPRIDSGEMEAICLQCLPGVLVACDWEAGIHPDQVNELQQQGILDYARKFIDKFNQDHQRKGI